jgi:hypothetical protein
MSDNGVNFEFFKAVCLRAARNDDVFKSFKRDPNYRSILEHVSPEQGLLYIDEIKNDNPQLLDKQYIDLFKQNDLIGMPITHDFGFDILSPTILRYVKVLSDLIKLFNNLDNNSIIEIGAGNGGLCSIISKIFKYKEYTLIDLPEVLELQKKCISAMNVPNVSFLTQNMLPERNYDLVISNYAFSECPDDIKNLYINKVLLKSKRGYLTMNRENATNYKGTFLKIMEPLNPKVIEEKPLTGDSNYIIVWGN